MACEPHSWNIGGPWGIIIGVSHCIRCGTVAKPEHFHKPSRLLDMVEKSAHQPVK